MARIASPAANLRTLLNLTRNGFDGITEILLDTTCGTAKSAARAAARMISAVFPSSTGSRQTSHWTEYNKPLI